MWLAVVLAGGCRIEVHPDFDTNTFECLVSLLERAYAVFGLRRPTRIYLAAGVTDMRKGFDGLFSLVRDHSSPARFSTLSACLARHCSQNAGNRKRVNEV